MKQYMTVKASDGSTWGVPVMMIAQNRAENYACEFDGDVTRSLEEDTLPLFADDPYEIEDWAANQMNWGDFDGHQVKIADAPPVDFQDAWRCGEKGFADEVAVTDSAAAVLAGKVAQQEINDALDVDGALRREQKLREAPAP